MLGNRDVTKGINFDTWGVNTDSRAVRCFRFQIEHFTKRESIASMEL